MAIKELIINESNHSSSLTFEEDVHLPGASSVVDVSVKPSLSKEKIHYQFDEVNENINIKMEEIPHTDTDYTEKFYTFVEAIYHGPGMGQTCVYEPDDGIGGQIGIRIGPESDGCDLTYIDKSVKYHYQYTINIEYITRTKIGKFIIQTKELTLALPVYNPQSVDDTSLRTTINDEIVCFELIDINEKNASPVRVMTKNGIKAIALEVEKHWLYEDGRNHGVDWDEDIGIVEVEEDYIHLETRQSDIKGTGAWIYTDSINLDGYDYFCAEFELHIAHLEHNLFMGVLEQGETPDERPNKYILEEVYSDDLSRVIRKLDISSLRGDYRLQFLLHNNGYRASSYANVYNMWLE